MNLVPLCHALVDALIAFEHSGANEVDPDFAIRAMENMTSSLLQLDADDQRKLREILVEIAVQSDDAAYKEFVGSVSDMVGLAK